MAAINQPQTKEEMLPSRREFLYYLGGLSAALFSAGTCGLIYQYVARSVPFERQDGVYDVDLEMLPVRLPVSIPEVRAWLILTPEGLLSLSGICSFRQDAFPKWVDVNNRFECPNCGSKYKLDGTFIEGPARRDLDRFGLWIRTSEGSLIASEGEPVSVDDAVQIFIDTRVKIPGQPRASKWD
jgi:cytochrome b6-f complex iron-sulfur subunit